MDEDNEDNEDNEKEPEHVLLVPSFMSHQPSQEQIDSYKMQHAAALQRRQNIHVWIAALDTESQRMFVELLDGIAADPAEGAVQYWIGLIRGAFAIKGLCACCGEDHFAKELDKATKDQS